MSEPGQTSRAARIPGRRFIAGAGLSADRVLDTAQGQVFRVMWLFLPEPDIARNLWFQHLLASRFLTEAAQQALVFGSAVSVAREGGSALEVALVGVAAILPPALLGMYGGAVAHTLPVRIALAGAYTGQALLCLLIPTVFGTGLGAVVVLLLLVNTLAQVSAPTEASVLPLVASEEEMASAASLINLAAAAGSAFGIAFLAPLMVKAFGVEQMFYAAGFVLFLSASRVFDLPVGDKAWKLRFQPPPARIRAMVRWLVRHPAVLTMIVVSVLAGTVNVVLVTLAPEYVAEVLDTDPADTAYIFAPTAIGTVTALLAAPALIRRWGERTVAIVGLAVSAAVLFLLGDIGAVADVIDAVNPFGVPDRMGLDLSPNLRATALLAVPIAFGVALTATSVQTYINRRVPLTLQGRTFAAQSSLRNATAIIALLTLGGAASRFGVETVLLVSPLLLLALGYAMIALSFRFSGLAPHSTLRVMESFWEKPVPSSGGNVDEKKLR
jgi:MFS family permease